MDKLQEARRIAIEAAKQDPDLHDYTLPVRTLEPWEPHRWVVNAVAKALEIGHTKLGERGYELIRGIVDQHVERIDRRISTVVDSVTERLRALEGTGDRTSSPARTSVVDVLHLVRDALVRVTALEDAPRRLNELDARCDALAARIDLLEAGRTGPRKAPIAYLEPSRIQVDQDRVRSMFPPGVADPTTEAIAQRTVELDRARDRIATLEKLLDGRDAHHEATMAKLSDATASLEDIAKACGIQPIGSRQQNTAAILHWLEVHTGASKLAETEWNRLRERVNPIIAAQFSGQDIGDAIVNTVQMLEAKLRDTSDKLRNANDELQDEQAAYVRLEAEGNERIVAIATERAAAVKQRDTTQEALEKFQSACGDQAIQIMELRGELMRVRTIVDEATYSLDAANAPDRAPLPMRVDIMLRQLADARKAIAEVWALVAERDGHGSPFWTEHGIDDTTPAQAVEQVLGHLRNKCTATLKAHDEAMVAARQHRERANDLEERAKRIEALHKNQHEQLADGAKLKAERDEAREHAAMFDVDRCNLRMDLDVAQATIKRMQPFVDAGQKAVGILHYDARPHPTLVAFMEAGEAYEQACAKAADIGLGNDADDGKGCGTEGCTDPDCPA